MPFPFHMLDVLPTLHAQWDNAAQWGYFKLVFGFIDDEVATFQSNLVYNMGRWMVGISASLITIWVMWQGFQSVQGRGRSLTEVVFDGARATFIVSLAGSMVFGGYNVYNFLSKDLPNSITQVMSGKKESAASIINEKMTEMEAVLAAVDALNVYAGDNPNLKGDQDRARWMAGIGVAGPMVVGGALLVMYKIGLALFVGFAPLFLMCLIFKSTQQLFQKWLLYGIGTMFAQALMAVMAILCFKIVLASAAAFGAQYLIAAQTGAAQQSVSSLAMLQGGIGLLLTLLLVTVPPMAAYFFQGTLGSYVAYSMFGGGINGGGGGSRSGPQGQAAGSYGTSGMLPAPTSTLSPTQSPQDQTASRNYNYLGPNVRGAARDSANQDVTKPFDGVPRA